MTNLPASDRPHLGVLLMLAFCLVIPFADGLAKLIGDRVSTATFITVRFAFQAVILTMVARLAGQTLRLAPRALALTALRTVFHIAGLGCIYLSFRFLPLADAIAIAFVMPFMLLALGHFVLGEHVGWRRTAAATVGFIGTLMVIQPSFAEVGAAALLPLLVALAFALFMLVTRQIVREYDPIAVQAVSGWFALMMILPVVAIGHGTGIADLSLSCPSRDDLLLLIALGLLGTLAHLLMTWSLRFAPSATLAPMQYLEIPVATLVGWLFFRDFPDGLALAGIAVTIAAGLYIVFREQSLSRAQARQEPAATPGAVE